MKHWQLTTDEQGIAWLTFDQAETTVNTLDPETLAELEHAFKFNDAVLRHLTVKMREAVTGPSPMMKEEKSRNVTAAGDEKKEEPKAEMPKAEPAPAAASTPA